MMKYPLLTLLVLGAALHLVSAQETKLDTRTIYRRYATQEFAARMLTVESSDISDVVLILLPGGTVSGRVVMRVRAPRPG